MKFNWDGFTKEKYTEMVNEFGADNYYGNIIIGDLCFDIVIRYYTYNVPTITLDCYVANEDTGYGYRDGMAYDYADGTYIDETYLSYDDFVRMAEEKMERYIKANDTVFGYSLVEKANAFESTWERLL